VGSLGSVDERARLIATASLLLDVLKNVRSRQPSTGDIEIVEKWITRVAGVEANLDAITEWDGAEAYEVNTLRPGDPLRRLFPEGLDDADFETELKRLEKELATHLHDLRSRPSPLAMTAGENLVDVLTGHGSARFKFLDVREVEAWRRERVPGGINIPAERVAEEAARVFRKDADLVVYGADDASTQAAARELEAIGFDHPLAIPGGFPWFKRQGWKIHSGPGL
jgi:rhodanese-related sulfurtransferase